VSADSAGKIVTYWLMPAEPALSYFRALIRDVALRLDAPLFEPHVTLYVTKSAEENPQAVLQSTLTKFKPFRLSITGLHGSDEFTKTLYVQFQLDAELGKLSEKLRAGSLSQRDYELNPHLSLVYKTMSSDAKRQFIDSIHLAFTDVEFDSVSAVISPAQIESREDVESWRMVAKQRLTG